MKGILAPHKDQNGYVYIRVLKWGKRFLPHALPDTGFGRLCAAMSSAFYRDDNPDQRIISSRRVEEAVETMDFLKRCHEESLSVQTWPVWGKTNWVVFPMGPTGSSTAGMETYPTLREAYYRYHAANDPR